MLAYKTYGISAYIKIILKKLVFGRIRLSPIASKRSTTIIDGRGEWRVWKAILCLSLIAFIFIFTAAADMPLGFYMAMNNQSPNRDTLMVKNYDTGATMTESYTNTEKLQSDTEVRTGSASDPRTGGSLEASINSNVIGNAHIAWQSVDPNPDSKGHHATLGRSIEDLTGVFSIEKFIQLWSDSQPGEVSVDWLPCS